MTKEEALDILKNNLPLNYEFRKETDKYFIFFVKGADDDFAVDKNIKKIIDDGYVIYNRLK